MGHRHAGRAQGADWLLVDAVSQEEVLAALAEADRVQSGVMAAARGVRDTYGAGRAAHVLSLVRQVGTSMEEMRQGELLASGQQQSAGGRAEEYAEAHIANASNLYACAARLRASCRS